MLGPTRRRQHRALDTPHRLSLAGCHKLCRSADCLSYPRLFLDPRIYWGYEKLMDIEFDPAKDEVNIAKHGVSLARAADLEIRTIVADRRRAYGEPRFNAFGTIEGVT